MIPPQMIPPVLFCSPWLSEETVNEIRRRYPEQTFDRNVKDPHEFAMHSFVLHRTGHWGAPPSGVRLGWWMEGRRIA